MKPLNKLKQYYKSTQTAKTISGALNFQNQYDVMRYFCIECNILTLNEIEVMEYEVNQSLS